MPEVGTICQRWALCICQRWALYARDGHNLTEVGTIWQRWALYYRGGHYTPEVGTICQRSKWQRWALYDRGGHYTPEVGSICQRWALYDRDGHCMTDIGTVWSKILAFFTLSIKIIFRLQNLVRQSPLNSNKTRISVPVKIVRNIAIN